MKYAETMKFLGDPENVLLDTHESEFDAGLKT